MWLKVAKITIKLCKTLLPDLFCSSNTAAITVCSTSTYARFHYWIIYGILFLRPARCFKLNLILQMYMVEGIEC